MTTPGDLRRRMQDMLQAVPPSPAPVEAIIRQGKRGRLRRTGAAAGGLVLAGLIAVAAMAPHSGGAQPTAPAASSLGPVVPGGVIAHGVVNGHPWQLAAQNIADPGFSCLPAIVLNGTDADPVYPDPVTAGVVALGPGTGFAFLQLPADVNGIVVDGQTDVPAVTVTACGFRYHVAGFAYSLAKPLQVTVPHRPADWPAAFAMPVVSVEPPSRALLPETAGLWINGGSVPGPSASGTVAWGSLAGGREWVINVDFGPGGDCYQLSALNAQGSNQMGSCGPVSTPDGPETIVALPIGFPGVNGDDATGYAVQISPQTSELKVTLSDGSTEPATLCTVDGRDYAAFLVRDPLRVTKLTWLGEHGQVLATTTTLPRYSFVQFKP